MEPCGWVVNRCGCPGEQCWDNHLPAVRERAAALATGHMWAATGRRYGLCEITVQPCNPRSAPPLYQTWPVDSFGGGGGDGDGAYLLPMIEGGTWYNRCGAGCSCRARCEVPIPGPTTTAHITQVTVAGETVAPGAYQVHDGHLLVRVDGQCWPTCVDYNRQDPPDFTVTYTRGEPVPADVQAATEMLACEYARACTGGECRLPQRLSRLSRQGVEVTVAEFTEWGDLVRTGISEVDRAIWAHNPHRLQGRPQVLSPDVPTPRVVT